VPWQHPETILHCAPPLQLKSVAQLEMHVLPPRWTQTLLAPHCCTDWSRQLVPSGWQVTPPPQALTAMIKTMVAMAFIWRGLR
jgi:hypothetical protein